MIDEALCGESPRFVTSTYPTTFVCTLVHRVGIVPGNWDTSWDCGADYGHALPQVYAEVAYNDLKLKGGKFYSILGYERVPAVQNFFYSHSYSMWRGDVPRSHTGFLREYSPNCQLTLYGGWTAGWDTGFDQNVGGDTFLGGFSYALRDNMNVDYSVSMGDFGGMGSWANSSDSDGYLHSIVFDWDINCRLKCVVQSLYGDNGQRYGGNGKLFSLSNYLLYTINCQWSVGSRFEWLKSQGTQEWANLTLGANYRPHPNVILRPEFRIDEFNGINLQDQSMFGIDHLHLLSDLLGSQIQSRRAVFPGGPVFCARLV